MQMKYYLDTCIWRDYFEDRSDNFRPLGEWAFRLIRKAADEDIMIVFSNVVKQELLNAFSEDEIERMISAVAEICWIESTEEQAKEAKTLSKKFGIPWNDAWHAVLSRDIDAILITRDRHLIELTHIVEIQKPEDLI